MGKSSKPKKVLMGKDPSRGKPFSRHRKKREPPNCKKHPPKGKLPCKRAGNQIPRLGWGESLGKGKDGWVSTGRKGILSRI